MPDINALVAGQKLGNTGVAVTASRSWEFNYTWNSAVVHDGLFVNFTDTLSNAGTLITRLQVNGEDMLTVNKQATMFLRKPAAPPSSLQAVGLIKLRAPVNEANSRFIQFYGPDEVTEQGYISSNAGNTGLYFRGSTFDAVSDFRLGYNSTGFYALTTKMTMYSAYLLGWSASVTTNAQDVALGRGGIALLEVNTGVAGVFADIKVRKHFVDATNTAGGTTGAQTINKASGTVNFAASAVTLVVTNSLVTTSSLVFCTIRTNDTTAIIKNVVPAAGSFTILLDAAATAETSVGFLVIN